ncbi:MAG: DUF1622 domain-containing protein [Chitinivibrionales bacterium]
MSEIVKPVAEIFALIVESIGITIITAFAVFGIVYAVIKLLKRENGENTFRNVRQRLGRGILLGLEFLVAADIIHTVAVEISFKTLGVLAIIVLIRTFLSFTIEVEITGMWPWQSRKNSPI